MRNLLILCILIQGQFVQSQDWKTGTLKLSTDSLIDGKFDIQHFGHLTAIRHLREDGTQGTYNVGQIDWIKIANGPYGIETYKTYNFLPEKATVEPKILLRELYSSDSIQLLSGNIRSIQNYFKAYPLPGLGILFLWGNQLVKEETVLLSQGRFENLTVISNLKGEKEYGQKIRIDTHILLKKMMFDYEDEILGFVKTNRLKWDNLQDMVRIVQYYDQLKYHVP